MTTKFAFISDPGHGWVAVTNDQLKEVGMTPTDFSRYSYRTRNKEGVVYYLEEDCDAGKFIEAWKAKHGAFEYKEVYQERTFIRNLPPIY